MCCTVLCLIHINRTAVDLQVVKGADRHLQHPANSSTLLGKPFSLYVHQGNRQEEKHKKKKCACYRATGSGTGCFNAPDTQRVVKRGIRLQVEPRG